MSNLLPFKNSQVGQKCFLLLVVATVGCEGFIVPSDYSDTVQNNDSGVPLPMEQNEGEEPNPIEIAILTPDPGSLFGPVDFSVTATVVSEVAILRVNFLVDGQQLAADFSPPYTATIPVAGLSDGEHKLSVNAVGYAGEAASSQLMFEVDATAPQIIIDGDSTLRRRLAMTSTVIEGIVTDERQVSSVELHVDGVRVLNQMEEQFQFTYDFGKSGTFRTFVKAVDLAGNISVSPELVYEIDQPPNVLIESPNMGEMVSGHVLLRATVSDDNEIERVVWRVNGEVIGDYASVPYSHLWNTCALTPGVRTISVSAEDSVGQTARHEISVTVSNEAEPITLTASALSRSVKLNWTSCASSTGHSYRLFYADSPNITASSDYVDVGETDSFRDLTRTPLTTTFYRVARVRDSMLVSPLSNEVAVTTYGEFAGIVRTASEVAYATISLDDVSFLWRQQERVDEVNWSRSGQNIATVRTSTTVSDALISILSSSGVATSTSTTLGRFPVWSESDRDLFTWRSDLQAICRVNVGTSSQACAGEPSILTNLQVVYPDTEERFCLETVNPDGSMNLWLRDWSGTRSVINTDVYSYEWVQNDGGIIMLVDANAGACRIAYLAIGSGGPQSGYYLVEDVSCSSQLAWSETQQEVYFTQVNGNRTDLYSSGVSSGMISSLMNLTPLLSFEGSVSKLDLSHDEGFVAVASQSSLGEYQLQVAPVDGSTVTTVLSQQEDFEFIRRTNNQVQP